jgi:hypothetical protein
MLNQERQIIIGIIKAKFTGAEKLRSNEATGCSVTSVNSMWLHLDQIGTRHL